MIVNEVSNSSRVAIFFIFFLLLLMANVLAMHQQQLPQIQTGGRKAIGFAPWKQFIFEISHQMVEMNKATLTLQAEKAKAYWSNMPAEIASKYDISNSIVYMGNNNNAVVLEEGDNFVKMERTLNEIHSFLMDFILPNHFLVPAQKVFTEMGKRSSHFEVQLDNTFVRILKSKAVEELGNMLANEQDCPGRAAIEKLYNYYSTITEAVGNIKKSLAKFFEFTKLANLHQMLEQVVRENEEEIEKLRQSVHQFSLKKIQKIIAEGRRKFEKVLSSSFRPQGLLKRLDNKSRAEFIRDGDMLLVTMLRFSSEFHRNAERAKLEEMKEELLGMEKSNDSKKILEKQFKLRKKINKIVEKMRQKLVEQIEELGEDMQEKLWKFLLQYRYNLLIFVTNSLKDKLMKLLASPYLLEGKTSPKQQQQPPAEIAEDPAAEDRQQFLMETIFLGNDQMKNLIEKVDQNGMFEQVRRFHASPDFDVPSKAAEMEQNSWIRLRATVAMVQIIFARVDRIFGLSAQLQQPQAAVQHLDRQNQQVRAQVEARIGPIPEELPELAYMLVENVWRRSAADGASTSSNKNNG